MYKSSDPPPPALDHFFVPYPPPSSSSCPPPPPPPSSSPIAAFHGVPCPLPPRDSPPLPASWNPPSTDPPTSSPPATPPVCRRRPSERDRLPPRTAPASGAPHPQTPRVGLLPILLLLHAAVSGLRGSAAAARLHVVASARASTSPPHLAASAFSLTVVIPNTCRVAPPRPPAYTDPARLPPNGVLLTQAN
jgi:hypothetical protein